MLSIKEIGATKCIHHQGSTRMRTRTMLTCYFVILRRSRFTRGDQRASGTNLVCNFNSRLFTEELSFHG